MMLLSALSLLASLMISACDQGSEKARIDGVAGDFCVPRNYVPRDFWWIPDDVPTTPKGFSFVGCDLANEASKSCPIPPNVLRVDVEPNNVKNIQTWANLKNDAILKAMTETAGTSYQITDEGRLLFMYNKDVWQDIFVWERAGPTGQPSTLADQDFLLAVCHSVTQDGNETAIPASKAYECRRHHHDDDYSISYNFTIQDLTKKNLTGFDDDIVDVISSWKCH